MKLNVLKYTSGMILHLKFVIVLYVTITYGANSFVLLTANVEDLKRIAHKFVSDSLADKIARFIVDAAEKDFISDHSDSKDTNDDGKNMDELFKVFSKNQIVGNHTRDKRVNNNIQIRGGSTKRDTKNVNKRFKKDHRKNPNELKNKRKSVTEKTQRVKPYEMRNYQSSLEYYRADNRTKINPNVIIDIEKIRDSDESMKDSRKEFERITSGNTNESTNVINTDNTLPPKKTKLDDSEIDDFDYNIIDGKTERSNVTTEVQRVEFDQYFNPHYTKPKIVATSGPVELSRRSKTFPNADTSTDYD